MTYAGFFKRTAAYIIDTIIYGIVSYVIALVLGILLALTTSANPDALSFGQNMLFGFVSLLITLGCYLTYYVWAESSAWQATIGKKIMGLKVTDIYGRRISFWRSLGRNFGMIISGIILCIGYLMCFWTQKKQCLHDKMAGCLVVDTTPNQKQGCVIGVIVAWIVLMILAAGIMFIGAIPQYNRALDRARAAQAEMKQRQAQLEQLQERLAQEADELDEQEIENSAE